MKTANKVINDRITILDNFINKTADSKAPADKYHRSEAIKAKDLFSQLKLALEEYTNLSNGGADSNILSELVDKITELSSMTMVPLVERNKQSLDNYKHIIFNFSERKNQLEDLIEANENGPVNQNIDVIALKSELNDVNINMINYNKAKSDIVDYIEEYEIAVDQIRSLVSGEESETEDRSDSGEESLESNEVKVYENDESQNSENTEFQ